MSLKQRETTEKNAIVAKGKKTGGRQFEKGNQAAKRRKHRRGGRPTREQARLKKLAADAAQRRLEEGLGSIIDAYLSLATGLKVGHHKRKLDPATVRHAVERVLGQAPRKLILDAQETVESFFEQIEKMSGKENEE